MAAPKGNKFWLARSKHGRNPKFSDPEKLWDACCEYFDWVEKHPLWETKAFSFQGTITKARLPKMRAMTLSGLFLFLDIDRKTWEAYAKKKIYSRSLREWNASSMSRNFLALPLICLTPTSLLASLGWWKKSVEGDLEMTVKVKHFNEKE